MGKSQDRYIRRLNVEHYQSQLLVECTEAKRRMLLKLLAEEIQKQVDCGDPTISL